jgi:hypothetical protein
MQDRVRAPPLRDGGGEKLVECIRARAEELVGVHVEEDRVSREEDEVGRERVQLRGREERRRYRDQAAPVVWRSYRVRCLGAAVASVLWPIEGR